MLCDWVQLALVCLWSGQEAQSPLQKGGAVSEKRIPPQTNPTVGAPAAEPCPLPPPLQDSLTPSGHP